MVLQLLKRSKCRQPLRAMRPGTSRVIEAPGDFAMRAYQEFSMSIMGFALGLFALAVMVAAPSARADTLRAPLYLILEVTNGNDDGPGSLRAAINASNAS